MKNAVGDTYGPSIIVSISPHIDEEQEELGLKIRVRHHNSISKKARGEL